jgi:hypothetical protein
VLALLAQPMVWLVLFGHLFALGYRLTAACPHRSSVIVADWLPY